MQIFKYIPEYQNWHAGHSKSTTGFVPTMGALHQGHLALMKQAKSENDFLIVSIFVNPIQFNNPEDLEKYPRTITADKKLLEEIGCDILFLPDVEEMYPEKPTKHFDFGELEQTMEGTQRPGHFQGVAIVLDKLFQIIEPTKAYFGEKDFQQLTIVRKLADLTQLKTEIIACHTMREANGLAMSSRNRRLSSRARKEAAFIHQCLLKARQLFPVHPPQYIKHWVMQSFLEHTYIQLEYFEIADEHSLKPARKWKPEIPYRAFVAAEIEGVRLIDNMKLGFL